jgi:hypothetical protein
VASSPISSVERFLLPDNRLVIDIENAVCEIYGPFYINESVPVKDIRASQYTYGPNVTRIVFDLHDAAEFSVSLSDDRMAFTISFSQTVVTGVQFRAFGPYDAVTMTGNGTPALQILPQTEPGRIDIRVINAEMDIILDEWVNGAFVSRVAAYGDNILSVWVSENISYDISYAVDSADIRFYPVTYFNIGYDYGSRTLFIPKASGLFMDVNAVRHTDDYANLRYTLTLPLDAAMVLGHGELYVGDTAINTVLIDRDASGFTRLVVNQARINAFTASENDEYYMFQARLPRIPISLYSTRVTGGCNQAPQRGTRWKRK